jgi:hypothetical protein
MPPTITATPPFGAAQPPGVFATTPQPQASMPVMSSKATDTTRYLCAAGHLDEGFQDYVMRHVIYEERRALGESYGVDMLAVVSWCKSGLHRINIRDGILTAILVLCGLTYFVVINLIVMSFSRATSSISSSYGSSPSASPGFSLGSLIAAQFVSVIVIVLALIVLIIWLNVEKWIKRRWPNSHPGFLSLPALLIVFWFFGFIPMLLIWLTIFIELLLRYYGAPVRHLFKNTFNVQARPVPLDSNLERKLQESFITGQRNVVVYSRFKPFAGAGTYKDGWSFVIDTNKGAYDTSNLISSAERQEPLPFTVSSLYDAVEKDVWALGINNVLEIEGKLYVHGQYLPEKPQFFNAASIRPVTGVDPRLVEHYKEHPSEDVRYYQCLRFNFWRGEMIFTAFLRFVQRGKELFTEINYVLLPPMRREYYWVDEREITPTISKIWQLYKRSFDAPLQLWLGAPLRLFRGYFYAAQQRKLARVALNNPAFDYGAPTSLRQEASDDKYHLFFQKLDEEMYLKTIEKQILETVFNFLKAHQIDTDEFSQRQQTILNSGVIVSGQAVNISGGAFAAGTGAHATSTSNPAPTANQAQTAR